LLALNARACAKAVQSRSAKIIVGTTNLQSAQIAVPMYATTAWIQNPWIVSSAHRVMFADARSRAVQSQKRLRRRAPKIEQPFQDRPAVSRWVLESAQNFTVRETGG
jgi:hypothetical protein